MQKSQCLIAAIIFSTKVRTTTTYSLLHISHSYAPPSCTAPSCIPPSYTPPSCTPPFGTPPSYNPLSCTSLSYILLATHYILPTPSNILLLDSLLHTPHSYTLITPAHSSLLHTPHSCTLLTPAHSSLLHTPQACTFLSSLLHSPF